MDRMEHMKPLTIGVYAQATRVLLGETETMERIMYYLPYGKYACAIHERSKITGQVFTYNYQRLENGERRWERNT